MSALARLLGEVLAVLVQRIELGLGSLLGHAGRPAQTVVGGFDRLARHALHVEQAARIALVVGQRDEQMLARGVTVAHLLGRLDRAVDDLHEVVARHGNGQDRLHLGLARNLVVDVLLKLAGIGPDALEDGLKVVLSAIEQGFEQVQRLDRTRLRVAGDPKGALESSLDRKSVV